MAQPSESANHSISWPPAPVSMLSCSVIRTNDVSYAAKKAQFSTYSIRVDLPSLRRHKRIGQICWCSRYSGCVDPIEASSGGLRVEQNIICAPEWVLGDSGGLHDGCDSHLACHPVCSALTLLNPYLATPKWHLSNVQPGTWHFAVLIKSY